MNIDIRYDNALTDMIVLLQQALFRYISNQEVDLLKFKHYFNSFSKSMMKLEENFHSSKVKFSKYLERLQEICKTDILSSSKINLAPSQQHSHKSMRKTKSFAKSSGRKNNSLNIIGQVDQQTFPCHQQSKKRSGTAEGSRARVNTATFTIQFENGRPLTGITRGQSQRYDKIKVQSCYKTLDLNSTNKKPARKSLYDDLQQMKPELISENIVKLPLRKRTDIKKFLNINKLF